MVWVPGGTFRIGSDKHYPEERPRHRVTVDGFWMDRYPVSNEQFARFIDATGHKTFAEIPPNPADYPEALPEMLYAGSLVFVQPSGPEAILNRGDLDVEGVLRQGSIPNQLALCFIAMMTQ